MSRLGTSWIASAALVAGQLAPVAIAAQPWQGGNGSGYVGEAKCESWQHQYRRCPVPTDGNVALLRVEGGSCVQNQSWGFDRTSIWVNNGCRAVFGYGITNAGYPGGGRPGDGWAGRGGYGGELRCESWQHQYRRCPANTGNRVAIRQVMGGDCVQGRSWGYDNAGVWVNNGCRAVFAYGGYAGGGGYPGGGYPGNQGYGGEVVCESRDYRERACPVPTRMRVQLVQQLGSAACVQNRSWRYDARAIYVREGCRGRFAYGAGINPGGGYPGYDPGHRPNNTGAIVGAGVLAAGLLALLASNNGNRSRNSGSASSAPARLTANTGSMPYEARSAADACFAEGARQIGATGGSDLALDRVTGLTREGAGWRVVADLRGTWPREGSRPMRMTCTANGSQVTGFDVAGL